MKGMIITVGVGRNIEHGIRKSIVEHNPDIIVFLVTERSKETLTRSKLAEILQGKEIKQFQLSDENDAEKCYINAREAILFLRDRGCDYITVDYTTGTKAMTAGVILAAAVEGIFSYSYVTGERDKETGRVISGTEKVQTISPASIKIALELSKIKPLFNSHDYANVVKRIETIEMEYIHLLTEKYKVISEIKKLANMYSKWENFDYEGAIEFGEKIELELISKVANTEKIRENIEFLKKLVSKGDIVDMLPYLIADVIEKANRRMEKEDFSICRMLIAKGYMLLGLYLLVVNHGIDLTAPSLLEEEKLNKYWTLTQEKVEVPPYVVYDILSMLGDDIGSEVFQDVSKLKGSLLPEKVSQSECKEFLSELKETCRKVNSAILEFVDKAKHVELR